ncbi:MAG: WYL domain-containing protein [Verrucomicrobiota bacterium]|nr:WYL domain-containing protein [Limisphaera sp.]MDW8380702.1 WYL domain-containing protein [Verrucomicrobiota bacterium]
MKSGRRGVSRPPLERMLRIHAEIQAGRFPNATTLARQLEVSPKSIQRDLEFMRDRLQLPLAYDARRYGYYYTEPVEAFPTVQLTEGELVALILAEKALQQYRGTPFERPLLSAIQKMEQGLPETISISLSDIEQSFSFRQRAEPRLDLAIFDTLSRAVTRRQQVEILYRKPGHPEPERRVIDPYHLANINGEWYLFAHDHLRQSLRTFVPARMLKVHLTGRTFKRPSRFSPDQLLRGSFGVRTGTGHYQVVLVFQPPAADYIREKRWHETQKLQDRADGSVELHLQLAELEEITRWVLSWGGQARVLRPRELVERVSAAARRLLEGHDG